MELGTIIEQCIKEEDPSLNGLQIFELRIKYEQRVHSYLSMWLSERKGEDELDPFKIKGDKTIGYYLVGSYYGYRKRPSLSYTLEMLDKILTFSSTQFEQLGARIFTIMNAKYVKTSPPTKDEGVDFSAVLPIIQMNGNLKFTKGMNSYIIGQSKRYNTGDSIDVKVARQLLGAKLAIERDPELQILFFDEKIPASASITPVFFTTKGKFTKGFRYLAKSTGMIFKNIDQISFYLLSNDIGLTKKDKKFSKMVFSKWLKKDTP